MDPGYLVYVGVVDRVVRERGNRKLGHGNRKRGNGIDLHSLARAKSQIRTRQKNGPAAEPSTESKSPILST